MTDQFLIDLAIIPQRIITVNNFGMFSWYHREPKAIYKYLHTSRRDPSIVIYRKETVPYLRRAVPLKDIYRWIKEGYLKVLE